MGSRVVSLHVLIRLYRLFGLRELNKSMERRSLVGKSQS